MNTRIRIALGITLLLVLITATAALAKGNFSFITISGGNLKSELRITNPIFVEDYFAFADFLKDKARAPADPGMGFEIKRYYLDQSREQAFDHFHYYPDTGFVYYDGLVNGYSEYDGKWYTAKTGIKPAFENLLPIQASSPPQAAPPKVAALPITPLVITAGLAVIFLIVLWFRRHSAHS
jgi:hypothetical protein